MGKAFLVSSVVNGGITLFAHFMEVYRHNILKIIHANPEMLKV
jgi:hypothetical protein